jgi:periplasmic protein TonB
MRRYPFAFSVVVHLSIVGVLVLSPAVTEDLVRIPPRALAFIEAAALPAPSIGPPRAPRPHTAANPAAAPVVAPDAITHETGFEPLGHASPLFEGAPDGIPDGVPGTMPTGEPQPAPPPPPAQTAPVRVGGSIRHPRKVREVAPVYPAIAQAARVQGVVILEAVIGEDGRVRNLRVLRSIPLLDQAAVDAVRQWQFTPTLLNGEPVPVVMTVTVAFQLRD